LRRIGVLTGRDDDAKSLGESSDGSRNSVGAITATSVLTFVPAAISGGHRLTRWRDKK
jgi:hypothetical protein